MQDCMHIVTVCCFNQQKAAHWSRAFTERLTPDVKLVGSTISCEATLRDGDAAKGSRQNAHVQSYAMATDQVQNRYERLRLCCGQIRGVTVNLHTTDHAGSMRDQAFMRSTAAP
jgi:hypothetical protein